MYENKTMNDFLFALYESRYSSFFESFLHVIDEFAAKDKYLKHHLVSTIKKARVVIYS